MQGRVFRVGFQASRWNFQPGLLTWICGPSPMSAHYAADLEVVGYLHCTQVRSFEADSAKAFKKAAKEQLERAMIDFKATEQRLIDKEQEAERLTKQLAEKGVEITQVTEQAAAAVEQLREVAREVEVKERRLVDVAEFEKEREGALAKIAHLEEKVQGLEVRSAYREGAGKVWARYVSV